MIKAIKIKAINIKAKENIISTSYKFLKFNSYFKLIH